MALLFPSSFPHTFPSNPLTGERNFYMLQLSAQEVIDPTKKGGMARFINHSWYETRGIGCVRSC